MRIKKNIYLELVITLVTIMAVISESAAVYRGPF